MSALDWLIEHWFIFWTAAGVLAVVATVTALAERAVRRHRQPYVDLMARVREARARNGWDD